MRKIHGLSSTGSQSGFGRRRAAAVLFGSVASVLGLGKAAFAADYTWIASNSSWDTTSPNWSSGGVTTQYSSSTSNIAHFGSTGVTQVSVHANLKAGGFYFENSAQSFTISNDTFTVGNAGSIALLASAATGGVSPAAVETINSGISVSTANNTASYYFIDNDTDSGSHLVFNGTISTADTVNLTTLFLAGTGAGTNVISGGVNNGGEQLAITETATNGAWELSGADSYTGATTINSGSPSSPSVLILSGNNTNVLGATAIAVGGASGSGTLRTIGSVSVGTSTGGTLALAGGDGATTGQGILDMTNAGANTTTHTLTLNNATSGATVMTVGSATAPAVLDFGVGASSADEIVMSGTLSIAAGGGIVNLNVLGTPTGTSPYTLISASGITGTGSLVFANMSTTYTTGGETYTLYESGNSEDLGFAPASSTPEPGTAGIVVFGAGYAMLKRRRNSTQEITSRTV